MFKFGAVTGISKFRYMFINLCISIPFIMVALYSRAFNIFNINDHSYIEHFIYGVFGIPFFSGLLLLVIMGILALIDTPTKRNVHSSLFVCVSSFAIIGISYFTEYHRDANLVNHFWFDVGSVIFGAAIFLFIFRKKEIIHR